MIWGGAGMPGSSPRLLLKTDRAGYCKALLLAQCCAETDNASHSAQPSQALTTEPTSPSTGTMSVYVGLPHLSQG